MKSSILRKILAGSMAIAMVAGTGVSVSTGSLIGTNIAVSAADTLTEGDFEYQINEAGTVTTVKYIGSDSEVTVPSKINGTTVEVIGEGTFRDSSVVKKVTLPSTITTIGNNSFRDSSITSVNFPTGLKTIGEAAFYRCYYLKDVTFPAGLESIGGSAFEECKLFTTIQLPANLSSLGNYAFKYCSGVTSLTLSQTLTKVPHEAFNGLYISEVTIPAAVESIENYAFYNCRNLKKVTFAENSALKSIGYESFRECTALQSLAFPDTLQTIGGYCFYNCRSLQSVSFGSAFRGTEYNAFQNCTNLKNLTFPASTEYIGSNSFNGCVNLEWVKLGGTKRLNDGAFRGCVSLKSVYCGENFERIDNNAFYGDTSLTNFYSIPDRTIYLEDHCLDGSYWLAKQPDGVVYFGKNAYATKGKAGAVTIKDGTLLIDNRAFKASSGLTSIYIPASVTDIDFFDVFNAAGNTLTAINIDENHEKYKSVNGVVYSKDGTRLIYCPRAKSGTLTIPDEVEYLNGSALRNCNSITTLKLGLNTRSVDQYDFSLMSSLKAINVPTDNVNFSSDNGVLYNKGKTYLYNYPNKKIGAYTLPDTVSDTYYYAFSGVEGLTELNVPAATRYLYPNYFSKNASIKAINVNVNNQWYSSVDGVLYNKEKTRIYMVPEKYAGALSIPDTVTTIDGDYTFKNCTGITKLTIPASLTNMGDGNFDNCLSVTEFVVDPQNTRVASENGCLMNPEKDYIYAFPKGAATVTIPESIVSYGRIRDNASNNCPNLVTLNLSTNFNNFYNYYMFGNCPKFTTINVSADNPTYTTIDGVLYNKAKTQIIFVPGGKTGAYTVPETVNSIADYSFKDASKLTSITFPKNFTSTFDMGYIMENCTALTAMNFDATSTNYTTLNGVVYSKDMTELYYVPNGKSGTYTMPESVINIQNSRAFKNCSKLTGIVFSSGVRSLTFDTAGLTSLTSVTIPATVTEISNRFYDYPNVTISGYEGSYAETYANYNDVKFKKLANSVSLNKTSLETAVGRSVKLTATIDTTRTTDKTITWKSENTKVATVASDGTVKGVAAGVTRVSASTADGKTAYCNVLVNAELTNTSTISADSISIGESVTLNGSSYGGVGTIQYAMSCQLPSQSTWTTLQGYSKTAAKTFVPSSTGTYNICIKVKDGDGIENKKFFTLQVNDVLNNTSEVSDDTITIGEKLVIFGDSTGGSGAVSYKYEQKLSSANEWTTVADYSSKNAVMFKPSAAGTYDIRVTAKDSAGNTSEKTFTTAVTGVLANTSTISSNAIIFGDSITVKASATGGKGGYTYACYYKKFTQSGWSTASNFSYNTSIKVTPKNTGYYQICVKVKDADGTIAKEYYNVVVNDKLKNNSTISADTIVLGDTVTLNGAASDGMGDYTYSFVYKKQSDTKWTTKQGFTENATVDIKPANATLYDVCIKVKDAQGTIEKKFFTVDVKAKLANESTLSSEVVTLGNTITANAKATGGLGGYTYSVVYKKTSDTKWTTKQGFTENATVEIKPAKAAAYDVCVKVQDSTGTIVKKFFTVQCVDSPVINASVSADTLNVGDTLVMSCSATGGKAPYTYAFYYKRVSDSKWYEKQKFAANSSVSVKFTEADAYNICIKVQDANGVIEKKYFVVTVK